jgi:hypothetical protein
MKIMQIENWTFFNDSTKKYIVTSLDGDENVKKISIPKATKYYPGMQSSPFGILRSSIEIGDEVAVVFVDDMGQTIFS